jgi:glycosyltransferase involved in cell wall biosynthesis
LPKVIDAVPNVVFSIVGEAQANYVSYLNYLRKLVAELELSDYVRFENHVPEEFLPVTFAASDAVVFPYTSTVGMTPIAHLKAASYGKPIIASNIDNFNKEFMDHENALLVSPRDPDALGRSVIEVFTDDALSKKLSNNITLYCAERSKERAIGDLVKIYQDILERKESK